MKINTVNPTTPKEHFLRALIEVTNKHGFNHPIAKYIFNKIISVAKLTNQPNDSTQ